MREVSGKRWKRRIDLRSAAFFRGVRPSKNRILTVFTEGSGLSLRRDVCLFQESEITDDRGFFGLAFADLEEEDHADHEEDQQADDPGDPA